MDRPRWGEAPTVPTTAKGSRRPDVDQVARVHLRIRAQAGRKEDVRRRAQRAASSGCGVELGCAACYPLCKERGGLRWSGGDCIGERVCGGRAASGDGRGEHRELQRWRFSHEGLERQRLAKTAGRRRAEGATSANQVKSSQVKSSQIKSSQARSSQVKPGQARSGQARPGQVRSGQVRPDELTRLLRHELSRTPAGCRSCRSP